MFHQKLIKVLENSTYTTGVEFGTRIMIVNDKKVKLQVWDTGGQERFRAITKSYYRGAVAAFLVYDITRRKTFIGLISWLEDVRMLTSTNSVVILIGNKIDREREREVGFEEAQRWARENDVMFIETSALTGENVEDAFRKSARQVYENIELGLLEARSMTAITGEQTNIEAGTEPESNCCA